MIYPGSDCLVLYVYPFPIAGMDCIHALQTFYTQLKSPTTSPAKGEKLQDSQSKARPPKTIKDTRTKESRKHHNDSYQESLLSTYLHVVVYTTQMIIPVSSHQVPSIFSQFHHFFFFFPLLPSSLSSRLTHKTQYKGGLYAIQICSIKAKKKTSVIARHQPSSNDNRNQDIR